MQVIKIPKDKIFGPVNFDINEGFGGSFQPIPSRPYFELAFLDLKTNLSQKGNSTKINPNKYPFMIGDSVEGVCAYDKELHKGTITSFYKDENSELVYIYVLSDLCEKLPLFPETVRRLVSRQKGVKSPHSVSRHIITPGIF